MKISQIVMRSLLALFVIIGCLGLAASADARWPGHRPGHAPPRHLSPPRHVHHHHRLGHRVAALPKGYVTIAVGGHHYYYHTGVFYRPSGTGFVVVAAPVGAVVKHLPPGYTVVYTAATPYYHANAIYYTWGSVRTGHVVVANPEGEGREPDAKLYIYPKKGQTEEQQSEDRYACHRWAVGQTGFDPSSLSPNPDEKAWSDYRRAMTACLEAREYTVK